MPYHANPRQTKSFFLTSNFLPCNIHQPSNPLPLLSFITYLPTLTAKMATHPPSSKPKPNPKPITQNQNANASRKRAKTFDARTLAVQSADSALSATGELNVAAYVGAREFEIRALEAGMQRSKTALTSRAFQQVPRALRRRTASHNVKRVPRRLRARAKREVSMLDCRV